MSTNSSKVEQDVLRVTVKGSRQRRVLHSWGFNQLQNFIEYKAKVAGVPIVFVDPKNTSRTCPSCGYIAKANRDGEQFYCGKCGFVGHADRIAAVNIGRVAFQPTVRLEGFFRQVSLSPLGTIS